MKVEEWQLKQCTEQSCHLNIWAKDHRHCVFHDPGVLGNLSVFAGHARKYLNERAINPDSPVCTLEEPNLLEVYEVTLEKEHLESLRNQLTRPIRFVRCEFKSTDFFEQNIFQANVILWDCKLFPHGNQPIFYRCVFQKGLHINGDLGDPHFEYCEFHNSVQLELETKNTEHIPTTVLSNCLFVSATDVFVFRGSGCVEIGQSSFIARCMIGETSQRLDIQTSQFTANVTIVVQSPNRAISLSQCSTQADILFRGQGKDPVRSHVFINGLDRFAGAKITFRHVNLADYDVQRSDFRFFNVELDDVHFDRLRGRDAFAAERQLQQSRLNSPLDQTRLLIDMNHCYRNLKLAYDRQADYQRANSFHAGELWTQWTSRRYDSFRKSWLNGAWKTMLSWHTWYWLVSNFGQSVVKPLCWILCSFATAGVLYSLSGVSSKNRLGAMLTDKPCHMIAQGFDLALRNLTLWFRPDGRSILVPANTFGWGVALFQVSITIAAGAFLFLALRRRFKR